MNTPVRLGVLSLITSIGILHGTASSTATAEQPSNTVATVSTVAGDVGNIVTVATNLAQNHDKETILESVGQILQSVFSMVAALVHKNNAEGDASEESTNVVIPEALIASLADAIDRSAAPAASEEPAAEQPTSTASTLTSIAGNVGNIVTVATTLAQKPDKQTILTSVGQLLQSVFSIVASLVHKSNLEDTQAALEPVIVDVPEELVERLITAINNSREYLTAASLQELGCALQDAERQVVQLCAARRRNNVAADENEDNVVDVLNSLIHDLFAIIQSSGANEQIGESIADMLSNIVELAADTIKYERLATDDVETCAAVYVDRVCAELNRQIRHLMVQSALTLRGSDCTVDCCKKPGRQCAAAISMITGATRSNGNCCCKPCAKPQCSSCSTCSTCNQSSNSCCCNRSVVNTTAAEVRACNSCSSSSSCSTCNKPNCSCKSADASDDETRGCSCGCKPGCPTCVSMNCEGTEMRCPCNKPKPKANAIAQTTRVEPGMRTDMMTTVGAIRRVIVRCPCNRPTGKVTQNSPQLPTARQQLAPSRKDGNRILPEGHGQPRRKKQLNEEASVATAEEATVTVEATTAATL